MGTTQLEDNIGNSHVTYKYHRNGTVQIFVVAEKHPYKLDNETDIEKFKPNSHVYQKSNSASNIFADEFAENWLNDA